MANKIFTTFCEKEKLDEVLTKINSTYTVIKNKVFVFTSPQTDEYILTYSVDTALSTDIAIIPNTVLLHRNSDYKVLYSINAIRSINPEKFDFKLGKIDIDWKQYEKSVLITRKGQFTQLKTYIQEIVTF